MSFTAIDSRMSKMLLTSSRSGMRGRLPDLDEAVVDVANQDGARAPSGERDRLPARRRDGDVGLPEAGELGVDVADEEHQRRRPRILDPQVDRLVIDVLDFHQLDARPGAGHARGLVAFLRALNVEHREQPRVGVVVRPFTRGGQRRHLHPEDVVVEGEGPVHVLHERGERAGADDRARARRRRRLSRRRREVQDEQARHGRGSGHTTPDAIHGRVCYSRKLRRVVVLPPAFTAKVRRLRV